MAILFAAVHSCSSSSPLRLVVSLCGRLDRNAASDYRAVGLLAVAVVALQIAQTIAEEEVVRDAQISGPTRVRRFLSRFLVSLCCADLEA